MFKYPHYSVKILAEALVLVMENNWMRFGDIAVQYLTEIAMGMAPAPAIVNLYLLMWP